MKKLLLTLALAAMATFANAQGTIQFANNAGTRFNVNGVRPVNTSSGGPAANTYLFAAFVGQSADALSSQPVGDIGGNTITGGLITSPNPQAHQLPGFAADSTVFIQIRAWDSSGGIGNDWAAAKQRGTYGETAIRQVTLGPSSGPGTVIKKKDGKKKDKKNM